MELSLDISHDELPIFISEADEHLQVLDEILIEIEKQDSDSEMFNTAFRSAHTLKGMAGMIGHDRMTQLTHSLETIFDNIRKKTIPISSPLIDLCLESVDGLRYLREEIVTRQTCDVDVERLVNGFEEFLQNSKNNPAVTAQDRAPVSGSSKQPAESAEKSVVQSPANQESTARTFQVEIKIDKDSVASAARAFQLMMALQELGEISGMSPTMEQIESSLPVRVFSAALATQKTVELLIKKLSLISDVEEICIDNQVMKQVDFSSAAPLPCITNSAGAPQANRQIPIEAPSPSSKPASNDRGKVDMTVRTSVERLDKLMNLVGELITDRNHLTQIRNYLRISATNDEQLEGLSETVTHLARITDQLQEEVMQIRMLPVGDVFHKFPRMVRDLAKKTDKNIDLIIHGEDTELDRSMVEEINDPLIHLVRNSVDHGIETPAERIAAGKPERGTITLSAWHEQGHIILTVEDDGKGIDPDSLRKSVVKKGLMTADEAAALSDDEAIDLIFMPGLSTAEKVTDISGRGFGMDIVHNNIQRVNGAITVDTQPGKGSRFQIVLPLTLAIVPTLLVQVKSSTFAIPLVMVTETLRIRKEALSTIGGRLVTVLRGNTLPLVSLAEIFNFTESGNQGKFIHAVIVHSGKQHVGLVVDGFCGEEEVVVKSLGPMLGEVPGISSAAILGSGKVALIIDVPGLYKFAGIH